MIQRLFKTGVALLAFSAATQAQNCTDTLRVDAYNATCGSASGTICAWLVQDTTMMATYLWSNGATGVCQQGIAPGTYSVTVTAGNGCTYTASGTVLSDPLQVADCSYLCDPAMQQNFLEACVWSGTAPYTYLWSNGSTAVTVPNPSLGAYSVTVTDANGCSGTMSGNYQQPTQLVATGVATNATCGNNGSIDITVTGGSGMVYYDWYDAAGNWFGNNQDLTNVGPGTYTVYLYDSSQCSTGNNYTFTVGGAGSPQVVYQVMGENCLQQDGAIIVSALGFSGTPTFQWSNGATTSSVSGLGHGWYTVSVTDGGACTVVEHIEVYEAGCDIIVEGYVYNASATGTCNPGTAWGMAYKPVILQPLGYVTFTDAYGYYYFQVPATGNYTVELYTTPANASLLCPSSNSIAVNANGFGVFGGNDFYLTMPNSHDVSIDLYNYTTSTPGFPLWTTVHYCNNGTQPVSGTFDYSYDAVLTYDSYSSWWGGTASLDNHNLATHTLTFSYTNLYPGACESVWVDFNTATSAVLGSSVVNCVNILPTLNDANLADNNDCDTLIVVGSWDPNEKLVGTYRTGNEYDGGVILPTDNQLEYTIHFQNTGTAPAQTVVVRDTLDADLLPNTIEGVTASHFCNIRIEDGNILIFEFQGINLPDSAADYEGSNGFIHFYINRVAGLPLGTTIENTAAIYFDFNAPVITNTVVSIIDELSSTNFVQDEMNVRVMPNPVRDVVAVQYDLKANSEVSIELYNTLGERIEQFMPSTMQTAGSYQFQFATDRLASGVYFLNIQTTQGVVSQRIVKQ